VGQLPLAVQLDDFAVFESFFPARNQEIYKLLSGLDGSSDRFDGFWLWGKSSSGKSHLLQAVSDNMINNCIYIPMKELINHNPEIIEDLSSRNIVCIDDIDLCAGKKEWELAIFELFNQLLDRKLSLVTSSSSKVANSGFIINDLQSRLSILPSYKIQHLNDEESKNALRLRAKFRGIEINDDVLDYLLKRVNRDMTSLYEILDHLDNASLAAKRKLSIPFVKEIINQSD
jgi:DnaA family protein